MPILVVNVMYSVTQIKKGIKNPAVAKNHFLNLCQNRYHDWLNTRRGIRFLEQDWDNLILLDACRYDVFEQENSIKGELQAVHSNASTSPDFFRKNFDGGEFGDIVYYSANPHIDKYDFTLFDLFRLWESDFDDNIGTVLPSDAINRVLNTQKEYRNKRIIVHLMQPHRPFLGPNRDAFEQPGFSAVGVDIRYGEEPDIPFWWDRLEAGELNRETVWQLYRDTLRVALPEVQRLVDEIPGKTVISADHGNAFGENGIYGHPGKTHHQTLNKIPWLEICSSRKDIVEESATVHTAKEHFEASKEQLEALGYVQ